MYFICFFTHVIYIYNTYILYVKKYIAHELICGIHVVYICISYIYNFTRFTYEMFNTVLSKFVGLVGQSDIFSKCPTKNASVPDQMSDKNFPTEEKNIELGNS